MLLARYAPIDSKRYEKLSKKAEIFDKIMDWLPAHLFAIWTLFVAGMAGSKAQITRHYFWDWNDWLLGLSGLVIITAVFYLLDKKFASFPYKDKVISSKSLVFYIVVPFILFLLGFVLFGRISILFAVQYTIAYFAIYLIHTIAIDESKNTILPESKKYIKSLISIVLLIITTVTGIIIDDPVIVTASVVSLPFLAVLLFGVNIRHLERAKFYPIFIFAMFVVSREGWFIIPLLLLFILLRSYNYLRFQKVSPTFGVTDDRN